MYPAQPQIKETKKGSGFGKIILNILSANEQVRTSAAK